MASEPKAQSQQRPVLSRLVFATTPTVDADIPEVPAMDPNDLEFHRLSLTSGNPVNEPVFGYENWLLATRSELLQQIGEDTRFHRLSTELEEEFQILQRRKVSEWQRQQEELKLRERVRSLVNCSARPMAYPSVETGAESPGDPHTDIFSGDVLRNFSGCDGSTFLPSRPAEGRYVFGLSVDTFNPFLNKQAGKKASTTAVYMVLLNLPPSVRYKGENMYLAGVVPGLREPSLTQISHLLRPLVDELLEFWDPGVWYTRTPYHTSGKLVKVALVPLICDLKAARRVMGHGSHSAKKFCSICSPLGSEGTSRSQSERPDAR